MTTTTIAAPRSRPPRRGRTTGRSNYELYAWVFMRTARSCSARWSVHGGGARCGAPRSSSWSSLTPEDVAEVARQEEGHRHDEQPNDDPEHHPVVPGALRPEVDQHHADAVEGVQDDGGDQAGLSEAHDRVLVGADDAGHGGGRRGPSTPVRPGRMASHDPVVPRDSPSWWCRHPAVAAVAGRRTQVPARPHGIRAHVAESGRRLGGCD